MLTPHQEEAFNKAVEILSNNKRLLIKGSAGVGKTYLVDTLVKNLKTGIVVTRNKKVKSRRIVCSAPTNKAVNVLKNKVDSMLVSFQTTHSALKLKRFIDNKTGKESFKPSYDDKYPPLEDVQYLVIDEASMLSTELLNILERVADSEKVTLIFLGDDKQLSPVGEKESPVFERGYEYVELTQIIRQGEGNPIIELSRNLPRIFNKESNMVLNEKHSRYEGYTYTQDTDKILDVLAKANGTDKAKYLAFTNKEVDDVNRAVRNRIYTNPAKIEKGETLVFNAPYREKFSNNEEIKVKEVIVGTRNFNYLYNRPTDGFSDDEYKSIELKYYSINPIREPKTAEDSFAPIVGGEEEIIDQIVVIHEESEVAFKQLVASLANKAKAGDIPWVEYYRVKEIFADLSYNHALTIHKSQGSSYNQAIINVGNICIQKDLEERDKLLYTAITRASEIAVLFNV